MLGALGALIFGGRAVQGIELDLSDTSKTLPSRSYHPRNAKTCIKFLRSDR